MRVVLHNKLQKPQKIEATRIVVEDDYGNPIAVLIQIEPNHIMAELADDEDKFNRFLRSVGIDRTLVIDKVSPVRQN